MHVKIQFFSEAPEQPDVPGPAVSKMKRAPHANAVDPSEVAMQTAHEILTGQGAEGFVKMNQQTVTHTQTGNCSKFLT